MKKSLVLNANKEMLEQTDDPAVMRTLVATVFKGFKDEKIIKQACLEALMKGYSFQDIINKKIYAIPYAGSYSLVQSISDVRSIAMKSGQVGKEAPIFNEKDGKVISCTVTVKRILNGYVGDYTETVFFDEYYKKGKEYNGYYTPSQWDIRPRTMIAKVAEMHALRMAFPEELSQAYVEEEFHKETNSEYTSTRTQEAMKNRENLTIGSKEIPDDEIVYEEIKENHDNSCSSNKGGKCDCIPII